jgi:hypothetical protein
MTEDRISFEAAADQRVCAAAALSSVARGTSEGKALSEKVKIRSDVKNTRTNFGGGDETKGTGIASDPPQDFSFAFDAFANWQT